MQAQLEDKHELRGPQKHVRFAFLVTKYLQRPKCLDILKTHEHYKTFFLFQMFGSQF